MRISGKTHGVRAPRGAVLSVAGLLAAPALVLGTGTSAQAASCTASKGPYQKQVEKYLKRPVDGRQSTADCKAIRTFQASKGITPAAGYAGPVTWRTMKTITAQKAAGKNPNKAKKCPTNKGRIACVDLTRQLSWIQDGAKLRFGPVPVRTGRDGAETRTGAKKIYWRNIDHWSTLYDVRMPYAQFFDGGQAFHSVTKSMYDNPGSAGCVNMRPADAKSYWNLLKNGDDVFVYGRKPGT
ncbi:MULTISPECIES: L,D-transpeptidase family protein [unclassified Streptomyces]|uniref:L,D-transpeptidase family protein n=1 Tax=unclassified Streptomyces TaxID=2593676 RepID=UPI0001C1BAA0|nr:MULTISPECIES: L,D-transpeptidase family protein [unclassified Streptomyces]AEN11994.1 ErfK/YbiS/YcfS/YnhG family protein [Streptomyces sp. SirexAA-E]MYR67251.1 L,D-transpeptidase family protein [Streptomyces sp. SID4939]MYR98825.1 L,D-transpeptidase family protein [Streptomyces sp. SID4940]MYT65271.1 L,D-transpeptidase family protein [Streptomyces sp. SID8357]MYT84853.1 L,D-transpeptidase family protein [Streptomyces sp. SID8360]